MGACRVELAGPRDDPAIRRLLAANPIPGTVTVAYEREPSYFAGCETMGHFCQVVVVRDEATGDVAGLICRAGRPLWVNGRVEQVGYLGQLRVAPGHRSSEILIRGAAFIRELHGDGRAAGYLATLTEDNVAARKVLVDRPRRAFPVFREVDRLGILALILRARPGTARANGASGGARSPERLDGRLEIGGGSAADLPAIVALFGRHGATKQFFPAYTAADFTGPATLGFRVDDFVVARRDGEIVGVIGLWDQSSYKQTVVRGYQGALGQLRPLYNVGARLVGAQPLPAPGQPIRLAYASFICVAENDPAIFRALLRRVYRLAAGRGYGYLMVGLAERDPLLAVARCYPHIPYHSRLYTVCWRDEGAFHERLDGRIPYIEIAAL